MYDCVADCVQVIVKVGEWLGGWVCLRCGVQATARKKRRTSRWLAGRQGEKRGHIFSAFAPLPPWRARERTKRRLKAKALMRAVAVGRLRFESMTKSGQSEEVLRIRGETFVDQSESGTVAGEKRSQGEDKEGCPGGKF
jgi:hypothetical protein